MASPYTKETKKQRIIKTAIQLLRSAHNVNKVSIAEIAQEANVSPTTIYNNFGNRDRLIAEVIKQIARSRLEDALAIVKSDIPFPQKIQLIMKKKMEDARELDLDSIHKLAFQDAQLAELADKIIEDEVKAIWLEFIEDGKRQGYIEPTLSAEAIILYLETLTAGSHALRHLYEAAREKAEILPDLMKISFYGFLKKDVK